MTDRFLGSVHGKLINCVDCHTNITKIPARKGHGEGELHQLPPEPAR